MPADSAETVDVVVIGGGPAGASTAITASAAGRRVVLLERERFPRFHIGESLLPATNRYLRALGVDDAIRDARFVVKRGATFQTGDGGAEGYIDFATSRRVEDPRTYQVSRDRFDAILLERARAVGVDVREGSPATAAEVDDGGVRVSAAGGAIRARYLVDASGQSGFLAKRWRLRRPDPELAQVATHARFRGVRTLPAPRAGDIRVVSVDRMGWVWLIPLSLDAAGDGEMSVGVVASRGVVDRWEERGTDALTSALVATPLLRDLFAGSRRVGPVRRDADFSYAPIDYAGDRWLLAGDAGSFIDPVFSTGVLLALKSGHEAAIAVDHALRRPARAARGPLRRYAREQERTYRFFRRLVRAFYDPAFRDILCQPSPRFGLLEAMISALAGESDPPAHTRWRIGVLFGIVALHRRFGLVDRLHSRSE